MANRFSKWFSRSPSGVHSFTFSRDMTPDEIEETSRAMNEVFERMGQTFDAMDKMFDTAFAESKSRSKPAGPRR